MPLDLDALVAAPLPPGTKGLPPVPLGFSTADVAAQGWKLLDGDLPLPVAVLKASVMARNISEMAAYLDKSALKLAPHGKTTMCPQLFERQHDAGAWGITVATIAQAQLAHTIGMPRIILANELIGRTELDMFAALCAAAPDRAYYLLVDSAEGAAMAADAFARGGAGQRCRVLIEIGMIGARCGVRSVEQGLALAKTVAGLPQLRLSGIEGYEGLIGSADDEADAHDVWAYLDTVVDLFRSISQAGLFDREESVVLSAGGSAYYDLVARRLDAVGDAAVVPVLRSGCYITQDARFYRDAQMAIEARAVNCPAPLLGPALEVWARVLSRPEPDRAILGAGKRDLSFDIDLPIPQQSFRPGVDRAPRAINGWRIVKLSDQHAFALADPGTAATPLEVGDMVALGISHPCTTFDRWTLLYEVDDDYAVLGGLRTFF